MSVGHHDWACFASQQMAEMAVKALARHLGGKAWGHSLLAMVNEPTSTESGAAVLREAAGRLDRYYIPTRYPNGFDSGAPLDHFLGSDSRQAIAHAEQILDFVRHRLP
jgi:HEPN domain-containing protein